MHVLFLKRSDENSHVSALAPDQIPASRILIVDGSRGARRMLGLKLEKIGFEAVTAGSSSQALAKLNNTTFDVVCTSLTLPDESGLKLIEALRKLPNQGKTPVVLVSGQELSNDQLDPGGSLQITEIVDKARGIGYLVAKISEYCDFTLTQTGPVATLSR